MSMTGRAFRILAAAALCTGLSQGCSLAQKQSPHLEMGKLSLQANLDRDDLVLLDTVEGSSSTWRVLGGLIQVVDGSKWKVFFIPFFVDKFTYFDRDALFHLVISPQDRAYYRALEQEPDADFVMEKSLDLASYGIPYLFDYTEVTFRGKAFRLKTDD